MASNGVEEQPTSSTPVETEKATANVSPLKKEDATKTAYQFLVQGKRHLVVRDFLSAIESLGESCRLHAELDPESAKTASYENAEAHFFYGKALLEQSRLELGVFEGGDLGKTEEASNEDSDESGGEDEEDESEEADTPNGNAKSDDEEVESSEATPNGTEVEMEQPSASDSKQQESAVTSTDEPGSSGKVEENEVDLNAPSPSTIAAAAAGVVVDNEVPSTSSGITAEAAEEKQAEEELTNLELGWEVLEIAKLGFRSLLADLEKKVNAEKTEEQTKLSEKVKGLKKRLADTHCSLGEVATESENYGQAIEEFTTGLEILSGIEGSDSREIAQYHFQMGLAFSFDKKFQEALASFRRSIEIIENRISALKHKIETKQTAKDLGIELEENAKPEVEEVQELTALLPELQEKISDTIDAEKDSKKEEEETKKEHEIMERNSPVKNPNPPAVNDISHLVKKKKKAEEAHADEPPVKKMCTEVQPSEAMDTTDSKGALPTEPESAASTTNGHPIAIDA